MPYEYVLCAGTSCLLRDDCYRFTAEVLGRQDFFGQPPFNSHTGQCAHFLSNEAQIQEQAYLIWLDEGCPEGKAEQHWQQARQKVSKVHASA